MPTPELSSFENVAQLHRQPEALKELRRDSLFVLLLGPSSVGKSVLIRELKAQTGDGFKYISPYTTRPLRPGETDKISVDDAKFDELEREHKFVYVNKVYDARYGTPLETIDQALSTGRIPILDFPLGRVDRLKNPRYGLLHIYVFPPNLNVWLQRMNGAGRNNSGRMEAGLAELTELSQMSKSHPDIHYSVVNHEGRAFDAAQEVMSVVNQIRTR